MSGPSLRSSDSHASIHEAALNEARELTELFAQCVTNGEQQKAYQVADIVVEHWESRTLRHAEMEEEGLYRELAEESSELNAAIIGLTRDHNLMRRIVKQLKDRMVDHEADNEMVKMMEALIIIDEIHNNDEMDILPQADSESEMRQIV